MFIIAYLTSAFLFGVLYCFNKLVGMDEPLLVAAAQFAVLSYAHILNKS